MTAESGDRSSGNIRLPDGYDDRGEAGRGGMGIVHRAFDRALGRDVAIKILAARPERFGVDARRFDDEARRLAALSHPNIVKVHAAGTVEGRAYYAMDWIDGATLGEFVRARRRGMKRIASMLADIADAVATMHSAGILHRDIKPENILVTGDGRPILTDLGVSLDMSAKESMTRSGEIAGTPAYMAPEQAKEDLSAVDPRTDVYGLGATLYAAVTGRPPFTRTSLVSTLAAVASEVPERPGSIDPGVPPELDAIILKALEKAPSRRYPSAAALRDDLRTFAAGGAVSVLSRGALDVAADRLRGKILLLVTVLVVILGVAVVSRLRRAPADDAAAALSDTAEVLLAEGRFTDASERYEQAAELSEPGPLRRARLAEAVLAETQQSPGSTPNAAALDRMRKLEAKLDAAAPPRIKDRRASAGPLFAVARAEAAFARAVLALEGGFMEEGTSALLRARLFDRDGVGFLDDAQIVERFIERLATVIRLCPAAIDAVRPLFRAVDDRLAPDVTAEGRRRWMRRAGRDGLALLDDFLAVETALAAMGDGSRERSAEVADLFEFATPAVIDALGDAVRDPARPLAERQTAAFFLVGSRTLPAALPPTDRPDPGTPTDTIDEIVRQESIRRAERPESRWRRMIDLAITRLESDAPTYRDIDRFLENQTLRREEGLGDDKLPWPKRLAGGWRRWFETECPGTPVAIWQRVLAAGEIPAPDRLVPFLRRLDAGFRGRENETVALMRLMHAAAPESVRRPWVQGDLFDRRSLVERWIAALTRVEAKAAPIRVFAVRIAIDGNGASVAPGDVTARWLREDREQTIAFLPTGTPDERLRFDWVIPGLQTHVAAGPGQLKLQLRWDAAKNCAEVVEVADDGRGRSGLGRFGDATIPADSIRVLSSISSGENDDLPPAIALVRITNDPSSPEPKSINDWSRLLAAEIKALSRAMSGGVTTPFDGNAMSSLDRADHLHELLDLARVIATPETRAASDEALALMAPEREGSRTGIDRILFGVRERARARGTARDGASPQGDDHQEIKNDALRRAVRMIEGSRLETASLHERSFIGGLLANPDKTTLGCAAALWLLLIAGLAATTLSAFGATPTLRLIRGSGGVLLYTAGIAFVAWSVDYRYRDVLPDALGWLAAGIGVAATASVIAKRSHMIVVATYLVAALMDLVGRNLSGAGWTLHVAAIAGGSAGVMLAIDVISRASGNSLEPFVVMGAHEISAILGAAVIHVWRIWTNAPFDAMPIGTGRSTSRGDLILGIPIACTAAIIWVLRDVIRATRPKAPAAALPKKNETRRPRRRP